MTQEQKRALTCVVCGTNQGSRYFYHDSKDASLYLCRSCLKNVTQSVTRDQLSEMTVGQVKHHMKVRDTLAATYKNSFVATKKFCVGKKRNTPIIEVDEEHDLWALPRVHMPLAQSIKSIVDVEVTLDAGALTDDDDDLTGEIIEGVAIKDILPALESIISKLYRSRHTDLAPIPEGHFVDELKMILTLDDRESGLSRISINLLPFLIPLPSRVDAGYDCAYELISYLKDRARTAYETQRAMREKLNTEGDESLAALIASGQATYRDLEIMGYYLEQLPPKGDVGPVGSPRQIVQAVVNTVSEHIMYGEKVPDWKTQHTVGIETFLGAFYRYAPGLAVSDVVYIMDNTGLQFGKGGMLLGQECFAVDDFASIPKKESDPDQPIKYDDLLFVDRGEGKGKLVLAYKDGRRFEVNAGKYAHYLFAVINCILYLRSNE